MCICAHGHYYFGVLGAPCVGSFARRAQKASERNEDEMKKQLELWSG